MLAAYRQLIINQFEASLSTLNACIQQWPRQAWHDLVANLTFDQAAFHVLFYTDLYLGLNEDEFERQAFHREHVDVFREYEELQNRPQEQHYDRSWIQGYLEHCHDKVKQVVAHETEDSLNAPAGFSWLPFSRAELHVYNIRHIQHHAGHFGLILRKEHGVDLRWYGSGWRVG